MVKMNNEMDTETLSSRLFFVGLGMALKCNGELEHHRMQEMIFKSGASYDNFLKIFISFDLFSDEIDKMWFKIKREK